MKHTDSPKKSSVLKQVVSEKRPKDRLYQNGVPKKPSSSRLMNGGHLQPCSLHKALGCKHPPSGRSSSPTSTDSDIKFTRSGGISRRWCVCVIAAALCVGFGAAAGIYFGYQFLRMKDPPLEKVFRGKFRVERGDPFISALADPDTPEFRRVADNYRNKLDMLFTGSVIRGSYVRTEILALDGTEGADLVVYFNLHVDARKVDLDPGDVYVILAKEMARKDLGVFLGLQMDTDSLEIQERKLTLIPDTPPVDRSDPAHEHARVSPGDLRSCTGVEISFCNRLPYNLTSYPNLLGHNVKEDVIRDLVAFREVVDSECYSLAYEFVCQLLQPACYQHTLILPCRDFCVEFTQKCHSRIPARLRRKLRCDRFPDSEEGTSCISKPGCVNELQARGHRDRVCDGVMDCDDFSDELDCDYCPPDYFHCGMARCVSKVRRCDGHADCPNGADERGCLTVAPNLEAANFAHQYFGKGVAVVNQGGVLGKLCADVSNATSSPAQNEAAFKQVGDWLCDLLTYKSATDVTVVRDQHPEENSYIHLSNVRVPQLKFTKSPCKSKQVLQIHCGQLKCGLNPAQKPREPIHHSPAGARPVVHGDWPWHVALYKEDTHVCDATLVADKWLLTTSACFQGQAKATWTARFATVRLASVSPWEQQRRVVGMVKSPIEDSNIVMIKLNSALIFSNYVRPVCMTSGHGVADTDVCLTLGWGPNREQLQELDLREEHIDNCKNISITGYNSICMGRSLEHRACLGEEVAGAPLLCQGEPGEAWRLEGVSSWRVTCSKHTQRPRLYDKIAANIDWITKTITSV